MLKCIVCIRPIDLWGLEEKESLLSTQLSKLFKTKKKETINKTREAVKTHLQEVRERLETEIEYVCRPDLSDRERGKRLLFLFQRDLLPGINGKILETKANRDSDRQKEVSFSTKVGGWIYIVVLNASMLFYIFLFAVSQTSQRQQAWLQSFLVWLVMEIFLIGTAVVLLTHVVIPSFTFSELKKIKNYLLQSFRNHRRKQLKGQKNKQQTQEEKEFNSAAYLFVSYRIAQLYPELLESKVILNFSTAWPVQTYNRQTDMTKSYKGSLKSIQSGVANVAIFLITNAIELPPSLHDMTIGMVSAVTMGYFVLIHVQLYQLYPVLVIIPSAVIGVLVHFMVKASRDRRQADADVTPLLDDDEGKENDEEEEGEMDEGISLEVIQSMNNIDKLQELLVEKASRVKSDYEWAESVVGVEKNLENFVDQEQKLELFDDDGQADLALSQPRSGTARSRKNSNNSNVSVRREEHITLEVESNDCSESKELSTHSSFSLQSNHSVAEEDFPTSSRKSSELHSPAVSESRHSVVSSNSVLRNSHHQSPDLSDEGDDGDEEVDQSYMYPRKNIFALTRESLQAAIDASQLLDSAVEGNEAPYGPRWEGEEKDNYSMPSKESVAVESKISYSLSSHGSDLSDEYSSPFQYPQCGRTDSDVDDNENVEGHEGQDSFDSEHIKNAVFASNRSRSDNVLRQHQRMGFRARSFTSFSSASSSSWTSSSSFINVNRQSKINSQADSSLKSCDWNIDIDMEAGSSGNNSKCDANSSKYSQISKSLDLDQLEQLFSESVALDASSLSSVCVSEDSDATWDTIPTRYRGSSQLTRIHDT